MWLYISGGVICTSLGIGFKMLAQEKQKRRDSICKTPKLEYPEVEGLYQFEGVLVGDTQTAPITNRECIRYKVTTVEVRREYEWRERDVSWVRSNSTSTDSRWRIRNKLEKLNELDSGHKVRVLTNDVPKFDVVLSDDCLENLFTSEKSSFESRKEGKFNITSINFNQIGDSIFPSPFSPSHHVSSSSPPPPPPEIIGFQQKEKIVEKDKLVFCQGMLQFE